MTTVNEPQEAFPVSSEEAGVQRLRRQLIGYQPACPSEEEAKGTMLGILDSSPDCFKRTLFPGHFTGSVWAIVPSEGKVLLVHHRKLGKWLQPGGHADGSPLLLPVALRELEEESGLTTVSVMPGIFDLDVHSIPARDDMPEHLHLDVRFAVTLKSAEPLRCSEESHAVAWVPLEEIAELTSEESILRMKRKTLISSR